MSTHFEPGTRDWLAQMQRFIQPLKDRVMSIAARGWVRLVYRSEPMQLLQVEVSDEGPGIANVEQALKDGYSTGGGLGLGLSGARRLMNEFELESNPGQGTRVSVTRWK